MEYKQTLKTVQAIINDHTPKQKYAKLWHRKNQSSWSRFKEGTTLPRPAPEASALKATLLSAAIAHSRGRLHFKRVWQGDAAFDVPSGQEGLKWQRKEIEKSFETIRRLHGYNANAKEGGFRYTPTLSLEELSMVELLLNAGDDRYLRGAGEGGREDLPGAPSVLGM